MLNSDLAISPWEEDLGVTINISMKLLAQCAAALRGKKKKKKASQKKGTEIETRASFGCYVRILV